MPSRAGRSVPPRGRHRRAGADSGASTVELVITMPALLFAVLVIMQFGLWMHAQHVAQAAAREGVATAGAYDGTENDARERVRGSLDDLAPTILRDPGVEVARTANEVTVTVTGHAPSILGLLPLRVREEARGPVERFVPNGRTISNPDGTSVPTTATGGGN